jgi:hypothetical protein
MSHTLNSLFNGLHLQQSELFGAEYGVKECNEYGEISIKVVEEWLNSIEVHHDLNKLQKNNVESFATSLAGLLREIDPAKLKIVVDYIEEECELLLWRKSSQGVSKLSFDSYGQITYLFTGDSGQKTIGVFEEGVDMDKLLYRFLSK